MSKPERSEGAQNGVKGHTVDSTKQKRKQDERASDSQTKKNVKEAIQRLAIVTSTVPRHATTTAAAMLDSILVVLRLSTRQLW